MEKQLINTAVEETWETTGDSLATAGSSLEGLIHNLHGFPSGAHRREQLSQVQTSMSYSIQLCQNCMGRGYSTFKKLIQKFYSVFGEGEGGGSMLVQLCSVLVALFVLVG